MAKRLRSFIRDQQGTIAVTSAFLFTVLIGFAALGVDVGSVYTDRRKAQGVADLAVMAAVSDLSNADNAAAGTISSNKLPNASYVLQYGVYTPDSTLSPDQRFAVADKSVANAARVLLQSSTPLFFGKVITGQDQYSVQTKATATLSSFAAFAIGSRLLSVNGGLLNSLLGGMLGTTLSLSAMAYNSLLAMNIDAFDFMNALAARLSITGATYDSVLNASVTVGTLLGAMVDAGRLKYGASNAGVQALTRVSQAVQGLSNTVNVRSVMDLGPYDSMTVGARPKVSSTVSAFNMLSATGELANGANQVTFNVNAGIPGVASVTAKLAIGQRPQGSSWVTFGAAGASVHTAQTRLLITVNLIGVAPYSTVTLPIYVEIASGTATLTALKCGFPDISTSTATVGVTPGLVDAWIGNVTSSQFTNFGSAPNPGAATLVNVIGLTVTAKAHISISNMWATPVSFSYSDVLSQTKKTVSTSNLTSSLMTSLLGNTQLGVSVVGLGLGVPAISSGVTSLLNGVASPVDALLSSVLQTLGVGLGQADVWLSGIRCDGAVLVI